MSYARSQPEPAESLAGGGTRPPVMISGRAESILQSITDGYHVTDAEGRLTEINAAARALFLEHGIDPDSLIGKRLFREVFADAGETEAARAFEKTLNQRMPTTAESFYARWQRWHLVRYFPTPDGGVAAFFTDITERKLLVAAGDTFRQLVEHAPFGVYVVDADFRLVQVSEGAQKVFQNVHPLLGRDFEEVMRLLWNEPFVSDAVALFRHTLKTGEPYHSARTVERRHDIEAVEAYDWKLERVIMPDGTFGVICHFYDLSEKQAAVVRATFLSLLSQKLATVSDPEEIQTIAMREVGELMEVHRCYFLEVADEGDQVAVISEWRRDGVDLVGSYRTRDFGEDEWWQAAAQRPLGIDDVRNHPWTQAYAERYPPLKVAAYALAPFLHEGRWVASIGVSTSKPHAWTEAELSLLDNVIARVWPLVERARAESARRESEVRLQQALDAAQMGTFIWDVTEDRAEPDERFLALFGLPAKGHINHATALAGLIHPEDVERYAAAVAKAVDPKGTGMLRVEARVVLPDGNIRWLAITGQTTFGEGPGGKIRMAGAGLNITEGKNAEEKLRQSEEHFRAFITASSDSVYRMSADWSVMHHLQGQEFISSAEVSSSVWMEKYIHPDDRLFVRQTIQKAVKTETAFEMEYRVLRRDGSLSWTFSRAIPIRNKEGQITEWLGAASDISERKAAELALRESEARFRNMANNAPVMVWITEADGSCTFLSQSWYDFTGQTPATGLGFGWVDAVHPDDQKHAHDEFIKANELHGPYRTEYRLRRTNGEYGWALDTATPRFDGHGNYLGYIGSVIDITERKLTEEALRTSEGRKTALVELSDHLRELENPADMAFVAGELLGRTLKVSRCGYGVIHLAEETIVIERDWNQPGVQSLAGTLHFRDYGSYIENLKRGEPVIISDTRKDPRTAAGSAALEAISARAFVNLPVTEHGNFVALLYLNHAHTRDWPEDEVLFIREVAERTRVAMERRRNEQALHASMEEAALGHRKAEAASRAKDDFLAALSHELRTPLNPVLMVASELVNDPAIPDRIRTDLRMIQRNIGLEARLIDDLLDLTRISRGMLQIHLETVDTHSLLHHAEEIIRADMAGRKLDFRLHLEAAHSFVQADPTRLQQVFWNLLKNAVKFTPDRGSIRVRTSNPNPGRLKIAVEDTGRGIQPEILERIFDAFDQGDLGGRHAFGGLGLGLSISKALVRLHGGCLKASSEGKDKGAVFTVEMATVAPNPGLPALPSEPVTSSTERSLRLLVVEDDKTSLNVLTHLLRRRGHSVSPASSVAEALELAGKETFDLVISDLGLPDGTGLELMRAIKRHHGWPGIALSGFGMDTDLRDSYAAGFSTHLVKPVSSGDLTRAIASAVIP